MNIQKQPDKIVHILLISLFFLGALPGSLFSQDGKLDILTLKSGSVLRGQITEMTDSNKVSIETLCRNTWVFGVDEIKSMEFNRAGDPADFFSRGAGHPAGLSRKSGFYNISSAGLLMAGGNNDKNVIFSLLMTAGYQFHSRYYAGLGTGLEFFQYAQLPLFLDARYLIRDGRVSPYVMLRGGYSFLLEDIPDDQWFNYRGEGGYLWSTGMGIIMPLGQKNAISCGILYRYQDLTVIHRTEWNEMETRITTVYNRLSFRLGIMFY
jgi:hypothetical protein